MCGIHFQEIMTPVKKILVVDDVGINRLIPGMILRPFGYQVCEVSSGEEAIAQLQTTDFDLVLLDLSMSGLTGRDVLNAQLQNAKSPCPLFVAYTTVASEAHEEQLLAMGFDRVLAKPAKTLNLLALVKELVT